MSKIIEAIENEQMGKEIPVFGPGDTIVVQVKVKEGTRERLQAFEGVVIAKRNRGLNSSFTVRKISHGEGVERVFQTYSPVVDSVEVKRRGDVRRAKLYYLRGRTGSYCGHVPWPCTSPCRRCALVSAHHLNPAASW